MATVLKSAVYTSLITAGVNSTGALTGILAAAAAPVVTYVSGTIFIPFNNSVSSDSAQVQIGSSTSITTAGALTISASWNNAGGHFNALLITGLGSTTNNFYTLLGGAGISTSSSVNVVDGLQVSNTYNPNISSTAGIMITLTNYVLPPGYIIYTLGDTNFNVIHKLTSVAISQS